MPSTFPSVAPTEALDLVRLKKPTLLVEIVAALDLEPCFAPIESPESNGMAEASAETLKRDYVR